MAGHEQRAHALLSASGASRWMNCTPSARLEEHFAEEERGPYAAEGTLAHEFADLALRKFAGQITTRKYNSEVKKYKAHDLYSPEMDDEVQKYVDIVVDQFKAAIKKTPDAVLSIEEKLDLTTYIEDGFGTGDAIIIADGVLQVIDLKYGKGIKVSAENNPQLKLYGLGALEANEMMYDIHTVEISIVQPRLDWYSTWKISVEDLKAWAVEEVAPAAQMAYAGEGIQQAGDHCHWCKAAPKCAALAAQNMELIDSEFSDPKLLNDDQMVDIYNQSARITKWISAVSGFMLKEALAGKNWDGLKLVEGRSVRKWISEDEVIATLKAENFGDDEIMATKLQGITAIEKLLGKKRFVEVLNDVVIKPAGAPTLVKKEDPRPEFNSIENDFKNL